MPSIKMSRTYTDGTDSITRTQGVNYTQLYKHQNADAYAPGTDVEVEFLAPIVSATPKAIYIASDVDCTLKFNSSGAPVPQLDLKANDPYQWSFEDNQPSLFTADLTSFFLTNLADAIISIRIVVDP